VLIQFFMNGFCLTGLISLCVYFICVCLCVFCVFLFHTAYMMYCCEHSGVELMGLKPNPFDLSSFSACFDAVGRGI